MTILAQKEYEEVCEGRHFNSMTVLCGLGKDGRAFEQQTMRWGSSKGNSRDMVFLVMWENAISSTMYDMRYNPTGRSRKTNGNL